MGFDFLDLGFPKSGTDWKSINGKPYITVSAKGRSNQLSNKINDGTDFGPDTTLNATSPNQTGPPYSPTLGIEEAILYSIATGTGIIKLLPGIYDLTNAPLHTDPISGQQYKIYIPSIPNTSPTVNLSIISDVFTKPGLGGVISTSVCGAVIQSLDIVTAPNAFTAFIFGAFTYTDAQGGTNVNLYIDGIGFKTNTSASNDLGGIDVHNAATCSFGMLAINTNYSGEAPSTYNTATGLYWMVGGSNNSQIYGGSISITGYMYGLLSDLPHTHIDQLSFYYCNIGLLNQSGSRYGGDISYFEAQVTQYGIRIGANLLSLHIGTYNQADQASSGTFVYQYSIVTNGPTVIIIDMYSVGTSGLGPNFAIASGSRVLIKSWGLNSAGIGPYSPTVTTPAVPASATAQANTNPFPVNVYLYGGTVTEIQITKNGTAYTVFSNATGLALSGQVYKLNPSDSITVTYTSAPTWEWLSD